MSRAIDALGYYEAKAQQMQRASLRGDTKAMLALMQELAIDGGAIARRAIDSQTAPESATVAVTDRQLADAVNELRDIAIKYHAAGQLRERIAGVVSGLVRGEPGAVAVDAGALEALRSAMSKLRAPMSRTEYAAARAGIIEAAYSLLTGG